MYLGDSPYTLRIGERTVKAVDAWRTGLLAAFVPGYALYWWYRTAAELQALGRQAGNDNIRLNPVLMLVLVLFSGAVVPLIAAIVLLSEATKAAQTEQGVPARTSTVTNLSLQLAVWTVGPVAVIVAALLGASGGAILLVLLLGALFAMALTLVLYEQLQHNRNAVWSARRERLEHEGLGAGAQAAVVA